MQLERSFSILDSVDSTNNYAMGIVHAGMANHGQAWFAREQTAGKGQRGNAWFSEPGENIILTLSLRPERPFTSQSFHFNAYIALMCLDFLKSKGGNEFKIKWPNDLYWRDRKAGGILIENVLQGTEWRWSVVGIGININQEQFSGELKNPVSLRLITGGFFDAPLLARELQHLILDNWHLLSDQEALLAAYNDNLYRKNQQVKLKKGNSVFQTTIRGVDAFGALHTTDAMERIFNFGEISWMK